MATTIGDVTTCITEYIYRRQYNMFGSIPRDTMPQLVSKDKTNNRFYMKLKGKHISVEFTTSLPLNTAARYDAYRHVV